jgi:hypothetical protein
MSPVRSVQCNSFSRKQDQEIMGIVVHKYKDSIWLLDSLPGIPEHWAFNLLLIGVCCNRLHPPELGLYTT